MPFGDFLAVKAVQDGQRQVEKAQRVCHCRTTFADSLGDLFLAQAELIHQPPVRLRALQRLDVLSLEVLYKRNFKGLPVAEDPCDSRNTAEASLDCRAESAFARHQLESAALQRTDNHGLEYAVLPDGFREFIKFLLIE